MCTFVHKLFTSSNNFGININIFDTFIGGDGPPRNFGWGGRVPPVPPAPTPVLSYDSLSQKNS